MQPLSFRDAQMPLLIFPVYLGDVLVMLIKGLPVLPVVKCSHAHNVFFLVNDRQGQDIFNDPASFIYWSFL